MVAHFSDKSLIPKLTVLSVAEEASEALIDRFNEGNRSGLDPSEKQKGRGKNEAVYRKLLGGKLNLLPNDDRENIEPVLRIFVHVFHDEDSKDFKRTGVVEHLVLL